MNEKAEKGSLAERISVKLCRAFFILCRCLPQQKRCAILSRQPGFAGDLEAVGNALEQNLPDYKVISARPKPGQPAKNTLLIRQIRIAATSQLVITDGYVPAVCICAGLHRAKCIQLWHALGAIKAFGYLALNTDAGHSEVEARTLHMHEGYDLIVSGLSGAVPTLAQAFKYPQEQVVSLGLPRIDRIIDRRKLSDDASRLAEEPEIIRELVRIRQEGQTVVLYAPTFRSKESYEDIEERVNLLAEALPHNTQLVLARHPLDRGGSTLKNVKDLGDVSTIDALCCVDVVITDYSAVAFEAWLAGCKVLFWTPDIESYRVSPGLVIDPLEAFPDGASQDAQVIGQMLGAAETRSEVSNSSFDEFMSTYAKGVSKGATERIVKAVQELVVYS